MKFNRMLVTASAFSFVLGASSYALAQDKPAPAPQEQAAAKSMTLQGELVKVDADAKTITVKGSDSKEVLFTYNDKTEVKGAGDVAGLATAAGSKVSVEFTPEGGKKIATRIEVQSKQ